jgi:hypothetical protein
LTEIAFPLFLRPLIAFPLSFVRHSFLLLRLQSPVDNYFCDEGLTAAPDLFPGMPWNLL